ncbi:MAG: hypothetical protein IT306_03885 [Chloroflexi bacterium]|nr:hypothetical protein [Chloroflexota bacterium]
MLPAHRADDVLSAHSAAWLLRWARTQLAPGEIERPGPPPASLRTPKPSTVFLTVHHHGGRRGYRGEADTLLGAVMRAVSTAVAEGEAVGRLQLDIVAGDPRPLSRPPLTGWPFDPEAQTAWRQLTSFQRGMVIAQGAQAYWLVPGQLLMQGMARITRDTEPAMPSDLLVAAMRGIGWADDRWLDPSIELWSFETRAWIESADGQRALALPQGVISGGEAAPTATGRVMRGAAIAAAEYLLRVQHDDGSFTYTADPWLRRHSRAEYNIVRHSGTTAALYEVFAASGDERFRAAADHALAFQARWYRTGAEPGLLYVLDTDGKGKLGALGLGLLALTRRLDLGLDGKEAAHALGIARQIVRMQLPDGTFESYLQIKGTEKRGSVSLYYPGEAMLGLARLARLGLDPDGAFRDAAHRGAAYLIASRQGRDRLPPDAWLMQALDLLYDDRPQPSYVEHALAIGRSMLADQFGEDAPPAYVGGFGPEPVRSTRTTARVEGLVAGYRLAVKAGDDRAPALLADTLRTVPHLLQFQYTADNTYFLARPDQVLGGVRGGLDDAEIRIDYPQHFISAMLGLAELAPE